MKAPSSTRELRWILLGLRIGGETGILGVAVKCVDIERNTSGEGESLFATHAFAPQCQYRTRKLPSPSVFFTISTHSTATPGTPSAPTTLKPNSFHCHDGVKLWDFTTNFFNHLRALYAQ